MCRLNYTKLNRRLTIWKISRRNKTHTTYNRCPVAIAVTRFHRVHVFIEHFIFSTASGGKALSCCISGWINARTMYTPYAPVRQSWGTDALYPRRNRWRTNIFRQIVLAGIIKSNGKHGKNTHRARTRARKN